MIAVDLVVSATEVAVTATVMLGETVTGALYITDVVVAFVNVPQVAPLQDEPVRAHVTPMFLESLVIVTERLFCWP